jgi:predicted outer membrane lipoprotein
MFLSLLAFIDFARKFGVITAMWLGVINNG